MQQNSGVRAKFHQLLVKENKIDKECGHIYDELYDNRHDADYTDFLIFEKEDVDVLLAKTSELLSQLKKLIAQ